MPPTRMVGCRQLLRPNDTGGGAPARGWRTFCPSLACVLERQKCANPITDQSGQDPFPFKIVHLVQPTRFVSAPLDVRSMQVFTWGGVRWELRHAPHVAATVPWAGTRVLPTSAASGSSHTIAVQPPPHPQTAPREGGPLNGCVYIFVPSTGEDSAGAPTGITCDVWCSGDREGLISRSRSRGPRQKTTRL